MIIFLHGLGRLACSNIDALPSFPGASTIYSLAVEGVFREFSVVNYFNMVDPVSFVYGSRVSIPEYAPKALPSNIPLGLLN
jgi:hypothetical protein